MSGLATGILKNTTGTGVPSIAVAADFPTLNQNTTGNASTVTTNANLTGDVTSVGNASTVGKINGTSLASLGTGLLKNTTGTGVPSIAVGADIPNLDASKITTGRLDTARVPITVVVTKYPLVTSAAGDSIKLSQTYQDSLLNRDGTTPLTGNWAAGSFYGQFNSVRVGSSANVIALSNTNGGTGTITSTGQVTKGKMTLGPLVIDEANSLVGINVGSSPGSALAVAGTTATSSISSTAGVVATGTTLNPNVISATGSFADNTAQLRGLLMSVTGTGAIAGSDLTAANFNNTNNLTANGMTTMNGASSTLTLSNAGTAANVYGYRAIAILSNAGSISTQNYGFQARSPVLSGSGTIATSAGLSVQSQKVTGVTTGIGIEQLGTSDVNNFLGTINVGTQTAAASASLNIVSTTQGVLFPRMTTTQKNAIGAPAEGLTVYDLTLHKLYTYDGTIWQAAW
jgi:hypothetical protein